MGPGDLAIWVRDLDRIEPRRLAGTEGASWEPFWSPDSRFLGFVVQNELKKISIDGREPELGRLPGLLRHRAPEHPVSIEEMEQAVLDEAAAQLRPRDGE